MLSTMPSHILTCESCGSHQPFIVFEEELGELQNGKAIDRTMSNHTFLSTIDGPWSAMCTLRLGRSPEAEAGVPLAELIWRVGIPEQTFYR